MPANTRSSSQAFGVILATELWATGHLLGRKANRGSSCHCDGHWSGNRRGVPPLSFIYSRPHSIRAICHPLGHAHSRTSQPITTSSPHTLKPLTSNQPWRPNGVLYGRHWANAACTRASPPPALPALPALPFPSPRFHLPSVPAAIWLTPHQHPSSPHPYISTQQTCICTGTHIQIVHRSFYLLW